MSKKRPAGRPTKYSDAVLKKAQDYYANWKENGDAVPTIVGLAMACDVATNTVYNWARDEKGCEEFKRIFDLVEQQQHQELINNGLRGDFNYAITKMMLTKHGYSDKTEVEQKSVVVNVAADMPAIEAERAYKQMMGSTD